MISMIMRYCLVDYGNHVAPFVLPTTSITLAYISWYKWRIWYKYRRVACGVLVYGAAVQSDCKVRKVYDRNSMPSGPAEQYSKECIDWIQQCQGSIRQS